MSDTLGEPTATPEEPDAEAEERKHLQEFFAAVIKHTDEKWGKDPKCPMCGETNWMLGLVVDLSIRADPKFGTTKYVRQGIPAAPVICTNCSFIAWIAAKPAGFGEFPTP
jgi:hypothetical protein